MEKILQKQCWNKGNLIVDKKNCKFAVLFIDYEVPLIPALLLQNFLHIQKLPAIVHHLVLT